MLYFVGMPTGAMPKPSRVGSARRSKRGCIHLILSTIAPLRNPPTMSMIGAVGSASQRHRKFVS